MEIESNSLPCSSHAGASHGWRKYGCHGCALLSRLHGAAESGISETESSVV